MLKCLKEENRLTLTVVGSVEDVGVVELPSRSQSLDDPLHGHVN